MTSFINRELAKEEYYGNIEYKVKFENMNDSKIKKYATQMKFRIIEGNGYAIYLIGVSDDGYIKGVSNTEIDKILDTMNKICNEINSNVEEKFIINIKNTQKVFLILKIKGNFNIDNILVLNEC